MAVVLSLFRLSNMDTIRINVTRCKYVIQAIQDMQGKTSYMVLFSDKSVRFRNMDSVLDFINMNADNFGYISDKV